MIEYVRGELADLTPTQAVVDCNGVGYALGITLNTYAALQGKKTCRLYVYESIREDAYQLFGFVEQAERALFLLLVSVSGVGAGTARMILSALSPAELTSVIENENVNSLKAVKGIGLKTAQRIIVDLKDKVSTIAHTAGVTPSTTPSPTNAAAEEAIAALTMLGFAPAPSRKVVASILHEQPDAAVEQIIKLALKRL